MADGTPLPATELHAALAELPNWQIQHDKLHAEFKFSDFVAAFTFMTQVAFAAEAAQHHPEWRNVYNRVTIDLVTHDAGNAISHKDLALARQIDSFVR
jgi:4a-hydroxytetrahydrobiopterin dehydratase